MVKKHSMLKENLPYTLLAI